MARYAFGSMRDGQSIFEQAAVSGDCRISAALVEEMLGLVGTEAAIDLAGAVASGDAGLAIRKFAAQIERGADLKFLYLSLVDVLRDAAVWRFTQDDALMFRHSPSSLARVQELSGRKSREEWMLLLDIAFRSERDVLGTEFPRLGFELLLLRLVNAPGLLDVETLADESSPPAPPARHAAAGGGQAPDSPPRAAATTFARRTATAATSSVPGGGSSDLWDALLKNLGAKRKTVLLGLLSQMKGRREGSAVVISCPHQFVLDRLREEDKWPVLLQAVAEVAGENIEVRLSVSGEKKSPDREAAGNEEDRPEKRALSDPLLTEVLREFEGATVLEIKPAPASVPVPERAEGEEDSPGEAGDEAEGG
jgi:DNA polymerase III gamma/tau subunit